MGRVAPASMIAVFAVLCTLIPSITNAAYVQWIPCIDGSGRAQGFGNLQPTSNRARLLPAVHDGSGQSSARLELNVRADYLGEATCANLLEEGVSNMMIMFDALHLSETYSIRPSNWTCVQYADRAAGEQRYLPGRGSELRLTAQVDLGVLGLLPTFAVQVSFSASNKTGSAESSSACIYSEITPQLRKEVSAAARYGPIAVFLLVLVSGLLATLLTPTVSGRRFSTPLADAAEDRGDHVESILPGVADCLLYLQFVFFLGALTLRYPGFYQPVTSLSHWSALFSPVGPFGQDRRYDMVKDGIYEVNGTLTGTYGLELMSQLTGGPVTMDVWWNMVVVAATITAAVAVFMLVHRSASQLVPSLGFSLLGDKGLGRRGSISRSPLARATWKVLRVVMSYFLTPIVAISAYQLDHVILPAYHLALAALLIVLVLISLTWMWRTAPSNQLWVLFLDSSKRYRLARTDDPDDDGDEGPPGKNRDSFALIIFALQFAGGIAIGGFQFSPISQVVGLAAIELSLLASTAVLQPLRRPLLSVFVWAGVARLVVVALTAVFLPELDVSLSVRGRVAIAILAIHAAVLVFGCAVPAAIRLASSVSVLWAPAEKPQIYGLSQLRRRHDAVNNLSNLSAADMLSRTSESIPNSTRTYSLASSSYQRHSPHSPSNASSISFYLDPHSSPDALYFQAVPQQYYYFRPFRPSATTSPRHPHAASSSTHSPASSTSSPTSEMGTTPATPTTVKTSTLSPVTGGWEKPQRSSDSTDSSDRTVSATADPPLLLPPLAPQWSDYSFREADLYYGHGRARGDGQDSGEAAAVGDAHADRPASTVRHVASSVWSSITGRTPSRSSERQTAPTKGFEVRRPPRPPGI